MTKVLRFQVVALAAFLLCIATVIASPAQTFSVLYSFKGAPDGASPLSGVILDTAGNIYGTTASGGTRRSQNTSGCGTVFKLDTSGNETVLHKFNCTNEGRGPVAGLIFDAAGNLYGANFAGGTRCSPNGCGTVFKLSPTGTLTVLHTFGGDPDGNLPYSSLIQDAAGNLYGTTLNGGRVCNSKDPTGCGTVFKISSSGKESVLHTFTGPPDGIGPFYGGLISDAAGDLYGTTVAGGSELVGTVFKLDPSGNETILYAFKPYGQDGEGPEGTLAMDAAGNLYGATTFGGTFGWGTVFKVDINGKETILHSFAGAPDGVFPAGGVILDAAGNLYGTTTQGGAGTFCNNTNPPGCGTVFKIDTIGNETVLHSFDGPDGEDPYGTLVQDAAGNLYGTALGGGSGAIGHGTVWKLTP